MSFPRYPEYKDSGVEWLGEVPIHWEVSPFKWLLDRNDGGVWGDDPDGVDDTLVLRSTEQTVDGRWRLDSAATRKLSATERAAALLESGDLVVTKSSGSSLHIGKTTLVTDEIAQMGCCYSNFMQRLRMKPSFSPLLAWYILNNDIARLQFDLLSNSTTGLANLNGTMIGQMMLAIPPGEEQTAIATFLDRETAKIDALVAEQEKLIALLQEKRQAVISHAVTKGLDPNMPIKDSGVEWLGEVPEHWACIRLKQLVIESVAGPYGASLTKAMYAPDGYRVYGQQQAIADDFSVGDYFISEEKYEEMRRYTVSEGDVLVSVMGTIGKVAVVPPEAPPGIINPRLVRYRCGDLIQPRYLQSVLMCQKHQEHLVLESNGTTMDGLNMVTLGRVPIPTPPIDEQTQILRYLKDQGQKFDPLINEACIAISLLKERRTALISAAVTGQIDVRGIASLEAV